MAAVINGEQKTWHKISLDFTSPQNFKEEASTFRDYRLDVTFTNDSTGETIKVPGFFAADGDASNTSATSGNVWRVNFNAPSEGNWSYEASFRTGDNIAATTKADAGKAMSYIDGETGSFNVQPTDKTGKDFRGKGMILQDEGTHYLQHQGDGDYVVKGGPGIPENFLANSDFDNTSDGRHKFDAHDKHAKQSDPTWGNDKGSNVLGAVNYISEQGLNSIYVLALTIGGDGKDVSPFVEDALYGSLPGGNSKDIKDVTSKKDVELDDLATYDVSKLAQWDVVFQHMNENGINIHMLLQETENDQMFNNGTDVAGTSLDAERLIYMREMVARFGYLNGIDWNMGEENTQSDRERIEMAEFLKEIDGYDHAVSVHTYTGEHNKVYDDLLGETDFDGPSFQTSHENIRSNTEEWIEESAKAGDPWVIQWTEDSGGKVAINPYSNNPDSSQEKNLREAYWGHLTAGGSGGNWYFRSNDGSFGGHSLDQNMDDFTAYKSVWTWTSAALEFFNEYIPFWDMQQKDGLTSNGKDFVMAKEGEYYVVYLPYGEANSVKLNLSGHGGETFDILWYNPRTGGDFIDGGQVTGGGNRNIGGAPESTNKDWVVLVRNSELPDKPETVDPIDSPVDPVIPSEDGVSIGENGLVVIEAETAELNGSWEVRDIDGAKGEGILAWDTRKDSFKNPQDTLEYKFTVDKSGDYNLTLRGYKPDTGEPSDRNNDFFVKLVDSQGKVLQDHIKIFFSGGPEKFLWAKTFDQNDKKSDAVFEDLIAGEVYTLEVSGRSRQAGFDRIHLSEDGRNQDANEPASKIQGDVVVDPPAEPVDPPADPVDPPADPVNPPQDNADFATFYIVDTNTDQIISEVKSGDTIDAALVSGRKISMIAVPDDSSQVESVKMSLNGGAVQTENNAPYALFGDRDGDYIKGIVLSEGQQTLSLEFFSGNKGSGTKLADFDLQFSISGDVPDPVDPPADPVDPPIVTEEPASDDGIASYFFVDTNSDKTLFEIKDGAYIDINEVAGKTIGLYASLNDDHSLADSVKSARLNMDGAKSRVENVEPYALYGDNSSGDFYDGTDNLKAGETYELEVGFYSKNKASGKRLEKEEVEFTLYDPNEATVFDIDTINHVRDIYGFDAQDGDKLDLSDILSDYDPSNNDIEDFVYIKDDGQNSEVFVNVDGNAESYVRVAELHNTTGLSDENQLVKDGTLIV